MASRCGSCGKEFAKENLFVKTVQFHRATEPKKIVRKRVIIWLCPDCLGSDSDFNTASHSSSALRSEAKIRADAVRNETLKKIQEGGF